MKPDFSFTNLRIKLNDVMTAVVSDVINRREVVCLGGGFYYDRGFGIFRKTVKMVSIIIVMQLMMTSFFFYYFSYSWYSC